MDFENHPYIPEQSEDHNDLIGRLMHLRSYTNIPRITASIQRQEGGPELLNTLERVRIGASNEVTLRPDLNDPDFSSSQRLDYIDDDKLRGLVEQTGAAFEAAELSPDN